MVLDIQSEVQSRDLGWGYTLGGTIIEIAFKTMRLGEILKKVDVNG